MLTNSSFDDPENLYEEIPPGYVQVMTFHQVKGLEFPVVFVGNLEEKPRENESTHWIEDLFEPYAHINPFGSEMERSERNVIRQFFVAYSRAESDLFLIGKKNDPSETTLGFNNELNLLSLDSFSDEQLVKNKSDFFKSAGEGVKGFSRSNLKRRYSITGDILSYSLCKRQYGFFNELGFVPSYEANWSYGRLVDETLDQAHRHYRGELPEKDGGDIPTDEEIENYFEEVINALRAQSVYKINDKAAESVKKRIKRFNREEGPKLYPNIVDTEHRLQSTMDQYILEGLVDVLITEEDKVEIWDYKASKRPQDDNTKFENYSSQLKTYAELYKQSSGNYPDRGIIYFIGGTNNKDAKYVVEFEPHKVQQFIKKFQRTVQDIESDREEKE